MEPILQPHRAAIYQYIQGVLTSASRTEKSSIVVQGLIGAIRAVCDEACADYAEAWNRQNSRSSVSGRLAPEILTNCFRFVNPESLVRASHVCKRWRLVALAKRTLWSRFCFSRDRSVHQGIEQLSAMLERSRPAPFTFRLPRLTGSIADTDKRWFAALHLDGSRLKSYTGPRDLYQQLNPRRILMPHTTHLHFHRHDSDMHPPFVFVSDQGACVLPNLRHLFVASTISIPSVFPEPLGALKYLCFDVTPDHTAYRHLFLYCPHLEVLELCHVTRDTLLPDGPLPSTLNAVAVYSDGVSVDFSVPLASWSGQVIQRLVVWGAMDLSYPLNLFLSSFTGPISIHLAINKLEISLGDGAAGCGKGGSPAVYNVYPFRRQPNELLALRGPVANRLVSLSLSGDRCFELFNAHLHTPLLTRLEFYFQSNAPTPFRMPSALPSPTFRLFAPCLSDVAIKMPSSVQYLEDECTSTVPELRDHLRDLIAYDAALLESITVVGGADVIASLECRRLATYAEEYVEISDWGSLYNNTRGASDASDRWALNLNIS